MTTNGSLVSRLRELEVFGNKHIPMRYLRASKEQRLELLAGLIDSDGYVDKRGRVEITSVRKVLADNIAELVRSLGYRVRVTTGTATINGRVIGPKWRLSWLLREPTARLTRKRGFADRPTKRQTRVRMIEAITPVESVPVRCVEVSAPDGLFLAGREMVVTHNTVGGGREGALQAMVPGSRIWIAGPTMDLSEKEFRVLWELTVERETIPVRRKSERELWIQFENGSFVECRTEENPDQLIGEGVDLLIMAEAARFKKITWEEQLRPTLADRHGKVIMSSTPRGFNWFYTLFMQGLSDEFPEWRSFHVPTSANPLIDKGEIERVERLVRDDPVTNVVLRQEWLAEFVSYSGQVFPEFTPDIHVRTETFNPLFQTYIWVDPGITNPYCCLLVQVDGDEHVHVLDEIYLTGKATPQILKEVRRRWAPFVLDGGDIPRQEIPVVIDLAAAEPISMWRADGWNAFGTKPPLKSGIDAYHRMLRDPYRQAPVTTDNPLGIHPRITFSPRCTNAIEEHNKYHYPDETRRRGDINPAEVPVDADNHAISAIRYGLYAVFPELFNETSPIDEVLYLTPEDLGIAGRITMDDDYSLRGVSVERETSLGDY